MVSLPGDRVPKPSIEEAITNKTSFENALSFINTAKIVIHDIKGGRKLVHDSYEGELSISKLYKMVSNTFPKNEPSPMRSLLLDGVRHLDAQATKKLEEAGWWARFATWWRRAVFFGGPSQKTLRKDIEESYQQASKAIYGSDERIIDSDEKAKTLVTAEMVNYLVTKDPVNLSHLIDFLSFYRFEEPLVNYVCQILDEKDAGHLKFLLELKRLEKQKTVEDVKGKDLNELILSNSDDLDLLFNDDETLIQALGEEIFEDHQVDDSPKKPLETATILKSTERGQPEASNKKQSFFSLTLPPVPLSLQIARQKDEVDQLVFANEARQDLDVKLKSLLDCCRTLSSLIKARDSKQDESVLRDLYEAQCQLLVTESHYVTQTLQKRTMALSTNDGQMALLVVETARLVRLWEIEKSNPSQEIISKMSGLIDQYRKK